MKRLARRYAGRAAFVLVYCREAHRPDDRAGEYLRDGVPIRQAMNLAERRKGAELLRAWVEPERLLLLDGFGRESLFERLFGEAGVDNPMLVVGAGGKVVLVAWWADAEMAERCLRDEFRRTTMTPTREPSPPR
jgi:hypothetical protein